MKTIAKNIKHKVKSAAYERIPLKSVLKEWSFYRNIHKEKPSEYSDMDSDLLTAEMCFSAHILEKDLRLFPKRRFDFHEKRLHDILDAFSIKTKNKDVYKWAKNVMEDYHKDVRDLNIYQIEQKKIVKPVEVIKTRRSIRKWTDKNIDKDQIMKIIDVARWSPSSCNRQTIKILVIKNKDIIDLIGRSLMGGVGFASTAPVLNIVLVDVRPYDFKIERHIPYIDAGIFIQTFLLMAHYMGLGACPIHWTVGEKKEKEIREKLHIPDYYIPIAVIALGYPSEDIKPPGRKDAEEFVIFDSF